MIAVFHNEFSRKSAATALLLGLSIVAAQAQSAAQSGTPAEVPQAPSQTRRIYIESADRIQIPPTATQAAAPADSQINPNPEAKPESLTTNAIKVPAMGTEANAKMDKAEPARPKKRVRVVRRVHYDNAVYMPPAYYSPRPYYRFGYGYGPGIRLYRY